MTAAAGPGFSNLLALHIFQCRCGAGQIMVRGQDRFFIGVTEEADRRPLEGSKQGRIAMRQVTGLTDDLAIRPEFTAEAFDFFPGYRSALDPQRMVLGPEPHGLVRMAGHAHL